MFSILAAACGNFRAEIRVKAGNGASKRGGATDLQGKAWFQTREPISLKFQRDLLQPGDVYSIVNRTTGKTLLEKEVLGASLIDDLSLTQTNAADDILFHFYPGASGIYEDFDYGNNNVDLLISRSSRSYRYSTSLSLIDFDSFGVTILGFDDQSSVKDGITGWLNESTTADGFPDSKVDSVWFTTGHSNIVNPSH